MFGLLPTSARDFKERRDKCNNLKEARISEVHSHDEHKINRPSAPTSYIDGVQ